MKNVCDGVKYLYDEQRVHIFTSHKYLTIYARIHTRWLF